MRLKIFKCNQNFFLKVWNAINVNSCGSLDHNPYHLVLQYYVMTLSITRKCFGFPFPIEFFFAKFLFHFWRNKIKIAVVKNIAVMKNLKCTLVSSFNCNIIYWNWTANIARKSAYAINNWYRIIPHPDKHLVLLGIYGI